MSTPALDLIDHLNAKNKILLGQLDQSDFCQRFFSADTSTRLIELMIANLLHQVHSYGGELTRSICTALGRLASYPQWLTQVGPLFEALLGEVLHPEMAHGDSVKLDQTLKTREAQRPSPAAFAVGATARRLCEESHPLTHLGFFYLLEGTTTAIAPRLADVLQKHEIASPFVKVHATEDEEHRDYLAKRICDIVEMEAAMAAEIEYGYDCFALAYPLPVWDAAVNRALSIV